ncbi:hypothetical protein [Gymnodinialimonas hymeniacidonis]|uniref:hypothetical protein n=1 Tax=Gymnodinialimonas hymeniacidonis TaxID=3126508 RepID=UPI0034C5E912
MTLFKLCSMTAVALALSGCVVLDTAPPEAVGPGPFLTGNFNAPAPAPAPVAAPDLRSQLAGRTLSNDSAPGQTTTLRADGFMVVTGSNGVQLGGGQWSAQGNQLCFEQFGGGFDCNQAVVSGSTLRITDSSGVTTTFRLS